VSRRGLINTLTEIWNAATQTDAMSDGRTPFFAEYWEDIYDRLYVIAASRATACASFRLRLSLVSLVSVTRNPQRRFRILASMQLHRPSQPVSHVTVHWAQAR
jgi:hypothetical protein